LILLDNAVKYGRENGQITLEAEPSTSTVRFAVTDDGVGIPEEDLDNIFKRFYRVDKSRSREMGGTGLGLSIAQWIVDAHGGSIQVESREGKGSTFRVTLPKMG
jgi:signal transduction histidine kinase